MSLNRRLAALLLVCVTLLVINTSYNKFTAPVPAREHDPNQKPPPVWGEPAKEQSANLGEAEREQASTSTAPVLDLVDDESVKPPDAPFISAEYPKPQPTFPPWKDVFPDGVPKPEGSEYTRTIVMASLASSNVSWVDEQFGGMFYPDGPYNKSIYVANDKSAELHTKKNKGHEVMTYLTYIIDNYDNLPDVSIFIHAHRFAWHNNAMLDDDMAAMIRYLKPEVVVRRGYVNLRCHWGPGCPHWLHLKTQQNSKGTQAREEAALAKHWKELFPIDEMPEILSQPCCAQFAVSGERLLAIPRQRYIYLRSWITRTPIDDASSGRMFEYIWQYIFTGNAELCRLMWVCYCELYGMCFAGEREFDYWFELRYRKNTFEKQLRQKQDAKAGKMLEAGSAVQTQMSIPELEQKVKSLTNALQNIRDEAFRIGHKKFA